MLVFNMPITDDNPRVGFELLVNGGDAEFHRIEGSELGLLVIGFSSLFSIANANSYGRELEVQVKIEAPKEGSFFLQGFILIRNALGSNNTDALLKLSEILGSVRNALIGIQKRRGRRVKSTERINHDEIRYSFFDGDHLDLNIETARLLGDPQFIKSAKELFAPFNESDVSSLKISIGNLGDIVLRREDMRSFKSKKNLPIKVSESLNQLVLKIEQKAGSNNPKWKVLDGATTFEIMISDEALIEFVLMYGRGLEVGDIVSCVLRIKTTWNDEQILHRTQSIERILKILNF